MLDQDNSMFYLDFSMFEQAYNWIGYVGSVDECLLATEQLGATLNEPQVIQLVRKTAKLLEQQNHKQTSPAQIARFTKILQSLELEALKNIKIDLYNLRQFTAIREVLARRCLPEDSKFSYNQPLDIQSFIRDGKSAAQQAKNSSSVEHLARIISREF